jgi:hypothetical protein
LKSIKAAKRIKLQINYLCHTQKIRLLILHIK